MRFLVFDFGVESPALEAPSDYNSPRHSMVFRLLHEEGVFVGGSAGTTHRNQNTRNNFPAQSVPGMRFLLFDFALSSARHGSLGRKGGLLHSISWCAPILERVSVLTSELGAARTHDRDCAVRQRVSVRVQVLQQEVDGGEGAAPASPGRASSRNRLSDKIALLGPRQQDAELFTISGDCTSNKNTATESGASTTPHSALLFHRSEGMNFQE
eukprot:2502205-Rhodomonas_salina.3